MWCYGGQVIKEQVRPQVGGWEKAFQPKAPPKEPAEERPSNKELEVPRRRSQERGKDKDGSSQVPFSLWIYPSQSILYIPGVSRSLEGPVSKSPSCHYDSVLTLTRAQKGVKSGGLQCPGRCPVPPI